MSMIVDFDSPPVIETVVGAQFDQIPGFRNAHLGAFWKLLGDEWPIVNDAQPLGNEFEKFGEAAKFPGIFQIHVSNDPGSRLLIKNRSKDRLIQLQNGRFHVNWLGDDGATYPHYSQVRADFDAAWNMFAEFTKAEIGTTPKPNQWEVTYVNVIPQGTVWSRADEFGKAFSFIGPRIDGKCGPLENVSAELNFEIEPRQGRLHVKLASGAASSEEAATLTLTARGPIGGDAVATLGAGLDLGRASIVKAFESLTTVAALKFWGRRDASD